MKKLALYNGLNINKGDYVHTRYISARAFLAAPEINNLKRLEIDLPTYRENSNVLILSLDSLPKSIILNFERSAQTLTYAIVYETKDDGITFTYWRCFFINSHLFQSGNVIFDCTVDYWGSYFMFSRLENIRVTRCNRAIGEGVYDDVPATYGEPHYFFLAQNGINRPISEYCAVISIAVQLETSWFGSNSLTQTFLFKLPLADIAAEVKSNYTDVDILQKVRFIVGGIVECGGVGGQNLKAQALRCWILPIAAIPDGDISLELDIKCSSILLNANSHTFRCKVVKAGSYTEDYDFHEANLGTFDNYYPNGNIAFGTLGTQMPLTRLTDSGKVQVWYMRESTGVKVIAYQGNNTQDISRAFELDVNINNQVGTSAQQFAENSAKIIALIAATAATYKTKGAGFAAAVGAGGVMSLLGQGGGGAPAQMNGDAATTYAEPSASDAADYVRFPFWIALTNSTDDEKAHARVYGASFNVFVDSISDIFDAPLLGEKTGFTKTFVAASVVVHSIPENAAEYISEEFKRGIYFE